MCRRESRGGERKEEGALYAGSYLLKGEGEGEKKRNNTTRWRKIYICYGSTVEKTCPRVKGERREGRPTSIFW